MNLPLPSKCPECGFENIYVWGTRINGVVKIEVRCCRCGKPLWRHGP